MSGAVLFFAGQKLVRLGARKANPTVPDGPWVPPVSGTFVAGPTTTGLRPGWTEAKLTVTGTPGGTTTVTTAGAVLENLYIRGRLVIAAADVTVRNCVVEVAALYKSGSAVIVCNSPAVKNLLIEDCVIRVHKDFTWWALNGIFGKDFTARRCNIYNVTDGVGVAAASGTSTTGPSNVLLDSLWIHDLTYVYWPAAYANSGNNGAAFTDYRSIPEEHSDYHTHNDGCQLHYGTGTRIEYCTIECFIDPTVGTVPLATAGAIPTGVPGMTDQEVRDSFKMPYASVQAGSTRGYQATGQGILLQVAQGDAVSAFIKGCRINGAVVGINFYGPGKSYDSGSATGNRFGADIRLVGGTRAAIKRTSTLAVALDDNTYLADGSAVAVISQ